MQPDIYELIYDEVKSIPKGKVATYGQIARKAGNKNWARVVGRALHNNPDPRTIPCHRVVNCKGMVADSFAFGGAEGQIEKLKSEGVVVNNGKVDLLKFGILIIKGDGDKDER